MNQAFNQPPPLVDYNLFDADLPLRESLEREGGSWAQEMVSELGRLAGTDEAIAWGFQANSNPPQLHTHDRFGNRIDEVEFHPAWHRLMEVAVGHGLHALPWRDPRPGAHAARAAAFYVWSQVEGGHGCPVSMTYAVMPALRKQPELAARWEPLITSLEYDPGLRPPLTKRGALFGMAMTEKQGGSDVRANTTRADAVEGGGPGGEYFLTGHKWFCSAPMCDAFLVLAQAPGGLSCFMLPRTLDDGERNRFHIQRLKDKLGNRSNASAEILLDGAWAIMVGEEGRGVRTIIEMVNHTRLDCVVGSASLMRQAVSQATTVLMMRLAGAFDRNTDPQESAFKRLALAVAKYWTTKRAIGVVAEALECHGGNGYVEESIMPRLYREAPLNSIWEGSGNVNALDVLRAMAREPDSVDAFLTEVDEARGSDPRLDDAVDELKRQLADGADAEARARSTVELMARVLEASLLLRHGDPAVAEAFCASRLDSNGGRSFGTLPPSRQLSAIVERHRPHT